MRRSRKQQIAFLRLSRTYGRGSVGRGTHTVVRPGERRHGRAGSAPAKGLLADPDGTTTRSDFGRETTEPNAARVADYLCAGRNNFEGDRRAARALVAAAPITATIAPTGRAFHHRVVRYLVSEAGVRQFIDIGTGLSASGTTHEVRSRGLPDRGLLPVHLHLQLQPPFDHAADALEHPLGDPFGAHEDPQIIGLCRGPD
jgi:hypothetical protein